MNKIIFELFLVTLLLNEAICLPTKNPLSEKTQTSKNPMRRFCKVKYRLMPKMASSFTTDFMMFKRPRIACFWVKTQSEKKIPKTASTTTKSPRITTTTPQPTTKMPKLCTFHIEFASLFNFCNSYIRT